MCCNFKKKPFVTSFPLLKYWVIIRFRLHYDNSSHRKTVWHGIAVPCSGIEVKKTQCAIY